MKPWAIAFSAVCITVLAGCQEEVQIAKPAAIDLTPEAAGHYCQMTVLEHTGPKAQIHLTGNPNPFWFTQIRDAVAFTLSPEEPKTIAAIYVNDMNKAESWDEPGADNWIDADTAWFVIGSTMTGGMGAPEAIPFGNADAAAAFSADNGGSVVRFKEIPESYVFGSVEMSAMEPLPVSGHGEVSQ